MTCSRLMSSDQSASYTEFKALNVTQPAPHVVNVELNRPNKMNAMNNTMWGEIGREGASLLFTHSLFGHLVMTFKIDNSSNLSLKVKCFAGLTRTQRPGL